MRNSGRPTLARGYLKITSRGTWETATREGARGWGYEKRGPKFPNERCYIIIPYTLSLSPGGEIQ